MATTVTAEIVGEDVVRDEAEAALLRAIGWFDVVERTCSRFLDDSELMHVLRQVGRPVPASPLLCGVVDLALAAAAVSGGAFDPTVGAALAARGFDRAYQSGARVSYASVEAAATYRDVSVDLECHTITIRRPLILDLGAVAKGLAVDLAVRELAPFHDFAVDAGGDMFLGGLNTLGQPWSVGIRHPREDGAVIETISVSDAAVCTSGDYERRQTGADGHHLIDPRTGRPAGALASVTVRAPTAVAADMLATAAFVLGADAGLALLEAEGVAGLMFTPDLERSATRSW